MDRAAEGQGKKGSFALSASSHSYLINDEVHMARQEPPRAVLLCRHSLVGQTGWASLANKLHHLSKALAKHLLQFGELISLGHGHQPNTKALLIDHAE